MVHAPPPVTYKFVFDPHAQLVRPVGAPRRIRVRRRAAARRIDLGIIMLAITAAAFGFTVIRAATRTPTPMVDASR